MLLGQEDLLIDHPPIETTGNWSSDGPAAQTGLAAHRHALRNFTAGSCSWRNDAVLGGYGPMAPTSAIQRGSRNATRRGSGGKQPFLRWIPLLAASSFAGCTPYSLEYPARTMPRQAFVAQVETVGIAPHFLEESPEDQKLVNIMASSAARELQRIGVRSLNHQFWTSCWRAGTDEIGGIYDSKTGEVDPKKSNAIRRRCMQNLAQHGADAIAEI